MFYLFVNINSSRQLGWHCKSNEHQSCHTVTLNDDVTQNPMSFEKKMSTVQKNRMLIFSKFSIFYFKIPVETPTFT